MSHPVWVRGLKQQVAQTPPSYTLVAPRVGAWIETLHFPCRSACTWSHPVWVRGLKPYR